MLSVDLKNVVIDDDTKKRIATRTPIGGTAVVRTLPLLESVIKPLALLKPTWTFVATNVQYVSSHENVFHLDGFDVFEGGEVLGHIRKEYARRDYKIHVSNERIARKRERGTGYSTEDPKKAIARIKKEFGRMTTTERINKAAEAASQYAYYAAAKHEQKLRPHSQALKEAALAYVSGPGFDTFLQYLKENEPHKHDLIVNAKAQHDNLRADMSVLEGIRDSLGSSKSALIVRDFEQYIVRIGDTVTLYDDNTLPVHLRGKLGLLKLVEKEHFVSGAGCRVSEEVFVVLVEDEATDSNNVSKE